MDIFKCAANDGHSKDILNFFQDDILSAQCNAILHIQADGNVEVC